jgi:Rrf2 family iron-sulfur cluster assembly transcriptional regulator
MISLSLTQTAEYALRAMSGLALEPQGAPVRANDLARRTGVPLPYLWKVMRRLVEAGLVHSAKGHGGGFRLARPASAITYMDILGVTGYDAKAGTCVFGWGQCRGDRPCPMHSAWTRLNESFVAWARSSTLAGAGAPTPGLSFRPRRP